MSVAMHLLRPSSRLLNTVLYLLMALTLLTSCESKRTIVNGLEEKEANEILVFLATRGIDATKTPTLAEGGGGPAKAKLYDVSVDNSNATEAMALLNQAGLPRRRSQSLLGILGNTGLIPSPLVEKARFQVGLAEQIASTIRKVDGILDADVSISFPEEDPLNPGVSKQKITASVYVKHNGILDDPNAHLMTRIKRLVAGSVNGLDFDNVTVIGDRSRFGDVLFGDYARSTAAQRSLVEIWNIVLAQESVQRFRILFFSLSLAVVLLTMFAGWLLWKFSLITAILGGFKRLFGGGRIDPKELAPKAHVDEKNENAEGDEAEENKEDEDKEKSPSDEEENK